ncbi:MAG: hypothetical protein AAGI25_01260 [Bacteroidota bacterium]
MKLRIKDNTLRLRFNQNERELLEKDRVIIGKTHFSPTAELIYQIKETKTSISVTFESNIITVFLPKEKVDELIETDLVTVHEVVTLEGGKTLDVTVEKDFQCLVIRSGEDDTHSFPNPLAK